MGWVIPRAGGGGDQSSSLGEGPGFGESVSHTRCSACAPSASGQPQAHGCGVAF